ncbi:hypothetical protein [Chitinophaga vietnamensis]|uniref:hypothetical protein n=1 Tax=Chitinophaga vietnamensis TaxID=2593957 RepID=UPI001177BC18|nr:hypothetical protein [Chitinophaga vietnamensis]
MENSFDNISVQVIELNCSYEKAFSNLKDPLFQKEWGVGFFKDITEENGQYIADTRFGKMVMHIDADEATGYIHTSMNGVRTNPSLLVRNGETSCVYLFALLKPEAAPVETFRQQGIPRLVADLQRLKHILESN